MRRREREGSTRNEDFIARKEQVPVRREQAALRKVQLAAEAAAQLDATRRMDEAHAVQICVHPARSEAIIAFKGGRIARCVLDELPDILAPVQTGFPEVGKIVASPDGAWVALISGLQRTQTTSRIEFRAWEDLALIRQLSPFEETIDDMVLSADGRWIAAVVGGGYVALIDAETGRSVQENLGGGDYHVPCFAPNHPLLAVSGVFQGGGILQVFRMDPEGQCTLQGENVSGFYDDEYPGMAFSPDGRRLALLSTRDTGGDDWRANVTLYDPEDMAIEWAVTLDAPTLDTAPWNSESPLHPTELRFHGDSEILYGTHHGHLIRLDRATGAVLQNTPFPASPRLRDPQATPLDNRQSPQDPVSIALQSDSTRVWAVCFDGQLSSVALDPIPSESRLVPWPILPRMRPTRTISPQGEEADAITLSPDGARVLAFDAEYDAESIQVLDSQTGERLLTIPTPGCTPKELLYSPDGRYIAMDISARTGRSDHLTLWDAQSGAELRALPSSTPLLWLPTSRQYAQFLITFAPNSRRIATSGGGRHAPLNVWDVETGAMVCKVGQKIVSALFSPDGTRLVTTTDVEEAALWDVESGEQICEIGSNIVAASFSSDGTRLLTANGTRQIILWNAVSGERMMPFTGESEKRTKLQVTFLEQDTKILILDLSRFQVEIREASSGRQLQNFSLEKEQDASVSVSPDGRSLVVQGNGPAVWDAVTETWISSPSRNRSSSRPTVWDIATETPRYTLSGHDSVCFMPDGTLLSRTAGGRLHIWDVNALSNYFSH